MKRMVDFAHKYQLNLKLAYYPPYHSKYNPIERAWGVLENHISAIWYFIHHYNSSLPVHSSFPF